MSDYANSLLAASRDQLIDECLRMRGELERLRRWEQEVIDLLGDKTTDESLMHLIGAIDKPTPALVLSKLLEFHAAALPLLRETDEYITGSDPIPDDISEFIARIRKLTGGG